MQTSDFWFKGEVTAVGIMWWLKAYLFVEAEKLTVAYPTGQHTVDMDVVGLQDRVETN